ncbi:uncharacterized protein tcerg1l isoform X4 [Mastacembelus armatus]|uniref:uncharacterized protein tcerg1l isoform X4 n=1 Tax=Mastacembelus armatus TaxID=205130 RepID=UPI000E45C6D8|nr:transcription elongation regulator 1-like protein isoform X4 [Mastacembelus armatus]
MMLPVSRFKGQPVGMVTTSPWLSFNTDPAPHWLCLASWSAATYQATPPLVFYPPAVWIPERTQLIQWERPAVEVVPLLHPFYRSAPLHPPSPLPKLAEGWISPEEVGMFLRRDRHLLLTSQIIQRPSGHAPRNQLLLSPSRLSGHVGRDATKTRGADTEVSSSSSPMLRLRQVSPLPLPPLTGPPTGGARWEWPGHWAPCDKQVWPLVLNSQRSRRAWLQPIISLERRVSPPIQCLFGSVSSSELCFDKWPFLPVQVMKEVHPSFFSSQFSSRFTLLTDCGHKKQGMGGGKVSYRGALLLRTGGTADGSKQCVGMSADRGDDEDEEEEAREQKRKDKRPVASTPVPGSPWCVVWTGDDQVFFFNPTIHLSVWERPGDLIGRDISHIIEDPPHKRKKTFVDNSCHSPGLHGNDEDDDDELKHNSKRNRTEESMSLVPCPGEVQVLSLEIRIAHFKEMMLERGVSAFSTWEKELHKMVFDPRYLLLTSDQRKRVFDQFVKSRVKDEYKEKKSKLQKAREEFKKLLEEVNITSRLTFKEFCTRYRGDQRFSALNRKREQEVLFNHYMTSLKKRDKENRARLRKIR